MKMDFGKIEVSDKLDQVVENSLQEVYKKHHRDRQKKWIAGGCGMAAAFAVVFMVGVANPSYAKDIPLVGHIFESMQDKFSYGGNYSGIGTSLVEETSSENTENTSEAGIEKKYTQTVDGVTVTLSEVYCNQLGLYLSMEIHSDTPFPDMYAPQLFTSEQYSFNSTALGDCVVLNGELVDANTYAGLVRFDLNDKLTDSSGTEKQIKLPDSFTMDLSIDEIRVALKNPPVADLGKTPEELEQMTDEEWSAFMKKWDEEHPDFEDSQDAIYKGAWTFSLNVDVNNTDTQVVDLSDRAENGIGFSAITKDRFEISVYSLNENVQDMGTYFPVVLDADGRLMDYGDGGSVCTVAINDSDVSQVDVFLIDESLWLDNLKGHWWKTADGLTDPQEIKEFKQLLIDNCAYHTTVDFE